MDSVVLLTGLWVVGLAIWVGRRSSRYYTSRLLADRDGIKLDGRGRRT
jgi:hypothetical protein